uniref:Protein RER1 n=1 Tax=Tetraselmis sp. GSL018 TaxID=582737 RepID=A0A061SKU8_9CHLO
MNVASESSKIAKSGSSTSLTAAELQARLDQKFQILLDKSTPHIAARWVGWVFVVLVYGLRVAYLNGFYIVTYGLGIYNLNLLLGFVSPQVDPDTSSEGPDLPTKNDQEFKPFVRKLPEFKFWFASTRSFLIGTVMTLFPVFDVPVFWPILLLYWLVLFTITMKRQIKQMVKYKYVPWSTGKKKYRGSSGGGAGKQPVAGGARKD